MSDAGRVLKRAVLAAIGLLLAGCAASGMRAPAEDPGPAIVRELELSAERWNGGDLAGFLRPYLDSSATTFVVDDGVIRGKGAIEALYRGGFWKDGPPRQRLGFAGIEVRPLGPGHALAVGRFQLYGATGALEASGNFSLVLVHTPEGWRIVHDHSS